MERTGCGQLMMHLNLDVKDEQHFVGERGARFWWAVVPNMGFWTPSRDHKIKEEDRECESKDGSVLVQQKR